MTPLPRPEQVRALAYLKRKGTDAPIELLRQRIADAFADFETMIASVPPSLHRRSPAPDRWSAQEVVDHLIESHRPAVAQLESLLKGLTPETGAVPASLQSTDPLSRNWDELVAELKHIHASLISLLEDASDSCSLEVRVPVTMVMKADDRLGRQGSVQWEEQLDWKAFAQTLRVHTIEHRSQIERTLRELSDSAAPEESRVK
ncbi:MAG TPA: DinB family protein [Pyrinomonadaceae bacterium]|nr:DinB family protein [Pyrinomonadaceae bacterium]